MEQKFEKLAELFKDAAVAEKLLACSAEEAVRFLKEEHSLEFTVEELEEVATGIKAAVEDGSTDELTSDQLEEVVGGGKSGAYYAGYYIGKTVIVGCVVVGGIAAVATLGW